MRHGISFSSFTVEVNLNFRNFVKTGLKSNLKSWSDPSPLSNTSQFSPLLLDTKIWLYNVVAYNLFSMLGSYVILNILPKSEDPMDSSWA